MVRWLVIRTCKWSHCRVSVLWAPCIHFDTVIESGRLLRFSMFRTRPLSCLPLVVGVMDIYPYSMVQFCRIAPLHIECDTVQHLTKNHTEGWPHSRCSMLHDPGGGLSAHPDASNDLQTLETIPTRINLMANMIRLVMLWGLHLWTSYRWVLAVSELEMRTWRENWQLSWKQSRWGQSGDNGVW